MRIRFLLPVLLALPIAALGHVGSPDVYYDGYAGPYHVLITIRPPSVIPGQAEVEVRSLAPDVLHVEVVPLPMNGGGADLAPKPDVLQASKADTGFFSGNLWIMLRGSWKIQIEVDGRSGRGEVAVPLSAVATTSAQMGSAFKILLGGLGLLLVLGLLCIVHAANGEAELKPRERLVPAHRRRASIRMGITLVLVAATLLFGNWWWNREASASAALTYRIPHLEAELQAGDILRLRLEKPDASGSNNRMQADELAPDHGHLLHLFLIKKPEMNSFWHLHPMQSAQGEFTASLPSLPAGRYQIYADIVHQNGFPETEVGSIILPAIAGERLSGDDAGSVNLEIADGICHLPDGYRMVWMESSASLRTGQPWMFRFRLEDGNGTPASDVENYMGMAGHAVFVSDDGKVFAHVHPQGSVSMAALAMAQTNSQTGANAMHAMHHGPVSSEISFPYGFPAPGNYHIFVQMKRACQIVTGAFRAHVEK